MDHKQEENLRMAYAIMSGVPAKRIYLGTDRSLSWKHRGPNAEYNDKTFVNDCGSSGCVCGWLAAHPYFQAQGLKYARGHGSNNAAGQPLLGMAYRLFGEYGIFSSGESGLIGKREALARIREALRQHGRITAIRNEELIRFEESLTN